jgi:hypothetical protein
MYTQLNKIHISSIIYKIYNSIQYILTYLFQVLLNTANTTILPDFATVFVFLVIISIGLFVYIKLRFPFWNIQPVYHTYDFWRYIYKKPFIIRDLRWLTKFCDFTNIQTANYLNISSTMKTKIIDLLRCKYIATDRLLYTINENILETIMTGNSNMSICSIYTVGDKLIGFMSSRPVQLYFVDNINNMNQISMINFSSYYWDYICTDQGSIDQGADKQLSRKLIQTHEYNQRTLCPQIKVSLFKKEINLCDGIVPLTKYKTYSFRITREHVPKRVPRLPHHTHVQQIVKTNIHILLDFLEGLTKTSPFTFLGISDLAVLQNMIVSNQLYAFCLKHKKDILGYYFFKNAKIQYEDFSDTNDCDTLHFIASLNNSQSIELFILGYLHSIKTILKLKKTFKMLLFDEITHNTAILPSWKTENPILVETDSAYYLYNMCYPGGTIKSSKVFIL